MTEYLIPVTSHIDSGPQNVDIGPQNVDVGPQNIDIDPASGLPIDKPLDVDGPTTWEYSQEQIEEYRQMLREKKFPCGHCSNCGALIYMELSSKELQNGAAKTPQGKYLCGNCAAQVGQENKPKPGRTTGGEGSNIDDSEQPTEPIKIEPPPKIPTGPISEPPPPPPPPPEKDEDEREKETSPPIAEGGNIPAGGGSSPGGSGGSGRKPRGQQAVEEMIASLQSQQNARGVGSVGEEFDNLMPEDNKGTLPDKDQLLQDAQIAEEEGEVPETLEGVAQMFENIDYENGTDAEISQGLRNANRAYENRLRLDLEKKGGYIERVDGNETTIYKMLEDGTIETTCIRNEGTDDQTFIQNWIYPDGTELTHIKTRSRQDHGNGEVTEIYEESYEYKENEETHHIFGDLEILQTDGIKPGRRDPNAFYGTMGESGFDAILRGIQGSGKPGPWMPEFGD